MNKEDYETECLRQLNDTDVYLESARNRLNEINKEIDNTIKSYKARGLIDPDICMKLQSKVYYTPYQKYTRKEIQEDQ